MKRFESFPASDALSITQSPSKAIVAPASEFANRIDSAAIQRLALLCFPTRWDCFDFPRGIRKTACSCSLKGDKAKQALSPQKPDRDCVGKELSKPFCHAAYGISG
jgi:hypothetical protein